METIGILYEHPGWFRPLFRELNRRGLAYDAIHAGELQLDPELVGFDPFVKLVDFLVLRAGALAARH